MPRRVLVWWAVLLLIGACSQDAGERSALIGADRLSPAAQAQLDSGNLAFRARNLEAAKQHYHRVAGAAPELATPWVGLAMVARATGDSLLLQQALAKVEQLSPGSTAAHPVGGALPPNHPPRGALPADHPALGSGARGSTGAK